MAYKQQPKSPVLKALVGDQHKLPKVLKDAIEAAPESPAKQTARPADPSEMTDAQRKEMAKKMSSTFADGASSVLSTIKPSQKVMKEAAKKMIRGAKPASPAKQTKKAKQGKSKKLSTTEATHAGYVSAGSYDSTKKRKDLKKKLEGATTDSQKRKIKKDLRMAERAQTNYNQVQVKNRRLERSAKVLEGTGGKTDAKRADALRAKKGQTPEKIAVVQNNKPSVKVSRRPKISEMGSPAKQTKKKTRVNKGERSKKMGVTTVAERQAQRDAARKAGRYSGSSNPRKMSQPKSKNKGPKKTLDGNVIKYSK